MPNSTEIISTELKRIWKEGSCLTEVLSQHLPGRNDAYQKAVRIANDNQHSTALPSHKHVFRLNEFRIKTSTLLYPTLIKCQKWTHYIPLKHCHAPTSLQCCNSEDKSTVSQNKTK
jgi:hypothetical protein